MILALDFDGVTHPVSRSTEPKFCRLPLLEEWLWVRPDVRVLISSSWGEVHPLDELVSFFSVSLQPRIVGVATVYATTLEQRWRSPFDITTVRYRRQAEIEQWLAYSGTKEDAWMALDDDPTLFEPGCAHLVLCDREVGLTRAQLDQMDYMLGKERLSGDGENFLPSMPSENQ